MMCTFKLNTYDLNSSNEHFHDIQKKDTKEIKNPKKGTPPGGKGKTRLFGIDQI